MELEKNVIDLWYHSEQIAMHFNQLIIQYRIQLFSALGAIGAISTFVINYKVSNTEIKYKLQFSLSLMILILFTTAVMLDIFYYSKLLSASVEVIIDIERKYDYLNMSTHIKSKFVEGGTHIISWLYGLIILFIFIFTFLSGRALYKNI